MGKAIAKKMATKTTKKIMSKKLKATKKIAKPRTKKAIVENMVFSQAEHTNNDLEPNVIFRKLRGMKQRKGNRWLNKEKTKFEYREWTYYDYESNYYLKKGRALYDIRDIFFYDEKGVKYSLGNSFTALYSPSKRANSIEFKDIVSIKVKKTIDFKYDEPFIISKGKYYSWYAHPRAELYIPMSYLEEMGYKIKRTKETDEQFVTTKRKLLVTKNFECELEVVKVEDFEAQKKALLKLLKTCKSDKDVADAVGKVTKLYRNRF